MWPSAWTQLGTIGVGLGLFGCGQRDSTPVEPVAFDHRVHAGDNQIGCTMCHPYAEHSPVAGLPSMANCYGCHRFVDADKPDKPEIRQLVQKYQNGQTLDWVRVNRMPDHVRFTHQRHVLVGVGCALCHGDVEHLRTVPRLPRQDMGWCLGCHRERKASIDCLVCHQ